MILASVSESASIRLAATGDSGSSRFTVYRVNALRHPRAIRQHTPTSIVVDRKTEAPRHNGNEALEHSRLPEQCVLKPLPRKTWPFMTAAQGGHLGLSVSGELHRRQQFPCTPLPLAASH